MRVTIMKRIGLLVGALCFVSSLAPYAEAQPAKFVAVVPDSADAFVVVGDIGTFDKKTTSLAKMVGAPPISLLDFARAAAGVEKGLDRTGPGGAAIKMNDDGPPNVVNILPVTDFDEVLKSLKAGPADGQQIHAFDLPGLGESLIAKKGTFAFTAPKTSRDFLVETLKSGKSVADQVKPIEPWLASQDIAGVVLQSAVRKGAKKLATMIPDAGDIPGLPEDQQKAMKAQLDWVRGLMNSVATEATHVAVAGRFDAGENLVVSARLGFETGGRFAKLASDAKGDPLAGLPSLPSSAAIIGMNLSPEAFKSLLSMNTEVSRATYNLTEAEAKELEAALAKTMKGVRTSSTSIGMPKENEPLMSATVAAMKVDDASDFIKSYGAGIATANKLMKMDGGTKFVKVGGVESLEVKMDMTSQLKGEPAAEQMIESLFGATTLSFTLVPVDAKTVLVGYVPADKMQPIVERYRQAKPAAESPAVARTSKLLQENSGAVVYLFPREIAMLVVKAAKNFGADLPIPEIAETTPLGIGVRTDPTAIELRLAIPADVLREIGKLVNQFRAV